MRITTRQIWRTLAVLLALALVAAACGDDDDDTATAPSDAGTEEPATPADAEEPATEMDTEEPATEMDTEEPATEMDTEEPATEMETEEPAPDDSDEPTADGTMADESLSPVKIGLIAQDQEFISLPEARPAAEAAVAYFNAELGGIDGHPVEVEICGAGDAPESSIACAQQFANADDVPIVVQVTLNSPATNETLANAGVVGLNYFVDFGDVLTPGIFSADPGLLGFPQAVYAHAAANGAETTTLLIADDPLYETFIPVIEAIAAFNGITLTETIKLGFEPDLTGSISAADTGTGAWFFLLADGGQCQASATGSNTVGYEGLIYSLENCLNTHLVETGDFDGWIAPVVSSAPTIDGMGQAEANGILETYGAADAAGTATGGWVLGNMFIAREALIAAGGADATSESLIEAMNSFSTANAVGFPEIACPGPSFWVGACNPSPLMVGVSGTDRVSLGYVDVDYSIFDAFLG